MTAFRSCLLALVGAILFVSVATSQIGELSSGQVLGNSSASQREARGETLTAMFNRAACAVANSFWMSDGATWGCVTGAAARTALGITDTVMPPGGRLVLNNAACGTIQSIQQSDIVGGGGTLCYVPHFTSTININGTNYTFATLSASLDSGHQGAGSAYDVWGVVVAGAARICIGGTAWPALTSSIAARSITKASNALYENSATISTCYSGSSSLGSFTAGQARYLGSVYATSNGNSQWIVNPAVATGGTANVLGVYNAYNRVRVQAVEREATPNWTYATATWRCVQNSCSNSILAIDGLGLSRFEIQHLMTIDTGDNLVEGGTTNVCIDCSPAGSPGSGPTGGPVLQVSNQAGFEHTSEGQTLPGQGFYTGIGVHTFVMIEIGGGGTLTEWFGNTYSGMFLAMEN